MSPSIASAQHFLALHFSRRELAAPSNEADWKWLETTEGSADHRTHRFEHPRWGHHEVLEQAGTLTLRFPEPSLPPSAPLSRQQESDRMGAKALVEQLVRIHDDPTGRLGTVADLMVSEDYADYGHAVGHWMRFHLQVAAHADPLDPSRLDQPSAGLTFVITEAVQAYPRYDVDATSFLALVLPVWLDPNPESPNCWEITTAAPPSLGEVVSSLRSLGLQYEHADCWWLPSAQPKAPPPTPILPSQIRAAIDAQDITLLEQWRLEGKFDPQRPIVLSELPKGDTLWLGYAYSMDHPESFAYLLDHTDPSRCPSFLSRLLSEASQYADVADEYWAPAMRADLLTCDADSDATGLSASLLIQAWLQPEGPGCPRSKLVRTVLEAIARVGGSAMVGSCWDAAIAHVPQVAAQQAYVAHCASRGPEAIVGQLAQGNYEVALALMRRYPAAWGDLNLDDQPLPAAMAARKVALEGNVEQLRQAPRGSVPQDHMRWATDQLRNANQVITVIQVNPALRRRPGM